jgi:hypothetical protein
MGFREKALAHYGKECAACGEAENVKVAVWLTEENDA